MFETSVVQARAEAVRGRASLLTVSVAAHSAVILGAIALSVASTEFPRSAPDQYELLRTAQAPSLPPPAGNPNAGRSQPAQPQPATTPPPSQVTAPPEVPDAVPQVEPGTGAAGPSTGTGTESGPLGQPWGVEGGLGDPDAPPSTGTVAETPTTIYYPGGEVKAPVLVHRVVPEYPPAWARTRRRAVVVVRCVIDRNGRVRDPQVIVPDLQPFNEAVLDAVAQWRYTPGSLHGQAVETYLEVKVDFAVR